MDFKNVPMKYRAIPFWSWNEKLEIEETKNQIQMMHDAGIGSFFMHARGGLETEYMGKEWFDNVSASIEKAEELGMYAWAYDENGWPSGFGGGIVNGKGEQNQQKYLRYEESTDASKDRTIAVVDGKRFYYDVNPFYVDVLDGRITEEFIEVVYEPYYKKYKNRIKGFFTDEPQMSRNGIPWSLIIPEEYRKAYGEEIFPHLIELFEAVGDYKNTRIKFWKLVCNLFSQNFMKKIYDWCTEHGLMFTGHMVCEETFESQLTANAAVMPHYEYFTIPGMDCLCRGIIFDLTPHQLCSVAQQLGKKQVLSETFALCGHNVSFNELKGIYQHQMVHGVNLLCQHLEGYSNRGIRKRDYPPAMYYQQPWWDEYKIFCESMARVGMVIAEGKVECNTLLLHPQTSAWALFDNGKCEGLEEFYAGFKKVVNDLDKKHVSFHLGDEIIIERHGSVKGNKFVIGEMEYDTVIIPEHIAFFENTEKLLDEFKKNGGKVVTPDDIKASSEIVDNPEIVMTKRVFDDFDVYYLVNQTSTEQKAKINKCSKVIDITSGEVSDFCGEYTFAAYDSLLLIDDGSTRQPAKEKTFTELSLDGEWKIEKSTPNILTLDYCDYYFDGELVEKNGYVLNIQGRACALKRPVNIKQVYSFVVEEKPEELFLVAETPNLFTIKVNGKVLDKKDSYDWIRDKAFKKIDISDLVKCGKNEIEFEVLFKQSAEVYENLEKSLVFESEKNKLRYDIEIEQIYLCGNFGVKMNGHAENLDRNVFRFTGDFSIVKMPEKVTLKEIEKQGFAFFAGKLTLSKVFNLEDRNYSLNFKPKGINVIKAGVNGKDVKTLLWAPFTVDLSGCTEKGENKITLEIMDNLRNMQGPFHLQEGESYIVCPHSFFKEKCVWLPEDRNDWNDGYCLAERSLI